MSSDLAQKSDISYTSPWPNFHERKIPSQHSSTWHKKGMPDGGTMAGGRGGVVVSDKLWWAVLLFAARQGCQAIPYLEHGSLEQWKHAIIPGTRFTKHTLPRSTNHTYHLPNVQEI